MCARRSRTRTLSRTWNCDGSPFLRLIEDAAWAQACAKVIDEDDM